MVIDSYIIGMPVYLTRVCLLFGQEASQLMTMVFLLVPVELIVVFEMLVTMGTEIGLNMYNMYIEYVQLHDASAIASV